ncbi:MAG TPA: cyclic lactone autoinducer peptide [Candidatus Paenibacillus intestinavium]|nr:cyclic lactone autoinducer peptide [Candidatus Paenibacillus intestinavium]
MSLVHNVMGKMQGKIAAGVILLAGIAAASSCTAFFFEEEVPQELQASLSQFK